LCTCAPLTNLSLHKNVSGKWSNSGKILNRIVVRGVAKNPVDHPNGGRTKAKQPELSPWGWVAKCGK
jgi:large subunit ribosomal protein L2